MWKEFRDFAVKGNVVDLAVGIIIGAAFGKIVTSFVSDILMPPIGLLLGKVDFANLYINMSSKSYASQAAATAAGAPIIRYGVFLNSVIDFLIVAFAVFLVVKQINRLKKREVTAEPSSKECPYCKSGIPISATRCPFCTSEFK